MHLPDDHPKRNKFEVGTRGIKAPHSFASFLRFSFFPLIFLTYRVTGRNYARHADQRRAGRDKRRRSELGMCREEYPVRTLVFPISTRA